MGLIERWWKVTARNGTVATWTDQDPSDRLIAAWAGAKVEGPFVPAAACEGAVEALRKIEHSTDREAADYWMGVAIAADQDRDRWRAYFEQADKELAAALATKRGAVAALDEFRDGLTEALNAHGVPAMGWREAIDYLARRGGQ